ncbi:hypothetical protein BS47DRAFT_662714 [Hydnum rufescens UP504]|uniref:DDHD domain-containing protein n=1 Tax=Hydnum rufescens UP504 TaxID=1448309 RepID=A0A9P6B3S8_9AGAM|nr:hypothetical protein BS47DRAFT_662714 [Hydnum rufescens UP504]
MDFPPKIHVRWFQVGVPELLSVVPITLNPNVAWKALTRTESDACEEAWLKLTSNSPSPVSPPMYLDEDNSTDEGFSPEDVLEQDDEPGLGVPVERERLFEVDVRNMKLRPIYWKSSGPQIDVMRGVWMYDKDHPVEIKIAEKIEEAYIAIKPWQASYDDELKAAKDFGPEAQEKLKYHLEGTNFSVIFDDAHSVHLIPLSYVPRRLTSFFTVRSNVNPQTGATIAYRGYDQAATRAVSKHDVKNAPPNMLGLEGINTPSTALNDGSSGRHLADNGATSDASSDIAEEVTDLILIVHGIGQGLTAQYEAFNFVYVTNLFRNIARAQATTPALASIVRSNHVQFLPVQWRASMKFDLNAQSKDGREALDNHFTLNEITPKGTIDYVRELTNNVLSDIPLFMSHHRDRMIESVCYQANRTYRLWCARNPDFDRHGRVHIIAHSLGSALVSHILSNQPTIVPPLSEIPPHAAKKATGSFLFNTSKVFMVGSPLSVFLRIHEVQLIARRGRERTLHSPPDEALDRVGLFGCLATDSIYNIFNPADPVAYLMNPCVDSQRAKELPPTPIPNVTAPVLAQLSNFSSRISKFFNGVTIYPFAASTSIKAQRRSPSEAPSIYSSPLLHRSATQGGIELADNSKDGQVLEGTLAERRFQALNPHGTLDYTLPSEGNISEYVDMITAHSSYWSDASLVAFVLAEIFAKKTDLLRTRLGADAVHQPGLI